MDKFELLGFLLQNLRDSREADEEDLDPATLRETTRIYELVVRHGRISPDMFDLSGIGTEANLPDRYARYLSTNYPISFVAFGYEFVDWLQQKDKAPSLGVIELFEMLKEFTSFRISVKRSKGGAQISVRSHKTSGIRVKQKMFVEA